MEYVGGISGVHMGYLPPTLVAVVAAKCRRVTPKEGGKHPIIYPTLPPTCSPAALLFFHTHARLVKRDKPVWKNNATLLPRRPCLPALPACRSRRRWSVWGRSTRPRLPLGVWSAPPGGADFGRYAPRFWALRARNTPASGGCGYEKGRPAPGGFFHWGGSITQRSQNQWPEPSTMPSMYAPGSVLLAGVVPDRHQSTGAAQWLYRRHVPHRRTPAKRNSP